MIQRLARNEEAAFAKGDFAQSNRALEMIGRHHGTFDKDIKTDVPTKVTIIMPDRRKDAV